MKINNKLFLWARGLVSDQPQRAIFTPPKLPDGVVSKDVQVAADRDFASNYNYLNAAYCGGTTFMGYPALVELSQLPEYRMIAEKPAEAMTRRWIKLTGENKDRIALIESVMQKLRVKELFCDAAKADNFFGGCHLYVDTGDTENPEELKMPLIIDKAKIKKGALRGFRLIEPIYCFPQQYNSTDPLSENYYRPLSWQIMGKNVHSSRLLHFVSRPVPTLLKPVYNFNGVSMSQLAKPYVDNWLKTRQNVNRLISNFSTSGIKTDLSDSLGEDGCGDDLMMRAQLFTALRDNQGLMILDNNPTQSEEFFQFNTPLSTLDKLQAQAQEHLASVSGIPLSILTGITPTGLNASSDGEIRIYYDRIKSDQENLFDDNLKLILKIVQLSEFGDIDNDISFEYESLWQQSETELATVNKTNAETAAIYIDMGAVSPDEVRDRIASDEDSGFAGLVGQIQAPAPNDDPAMDAEFNEGAHPRADNGQFGSGGGGKPKHSAEQIAKWAEEKRQRERAQAQKSETDRQENAAIQERAAKRVEKSAMAKSFNPDEISNIQEYYRAGDSHGAQAEGRNATVSAIERAAKSHGFEIDHVSESDGGKSKSLYIKSGNQIVRVSDHELPMTAKRENDRKNGLSGKWDREVIVDDWEKTPIESYISQIKNA